MLKIVALFNPADGVSIEAFEDWYLNKHVVDARKIPNLRRYTIHRVHSSVQERSAHFRLAELEFDDLPSAERSLASPEYQYALRDAKSYIKDHIRYIFESTEVILQK
jgi:uncharacterized protein (TIGR02118 family)